MYVNMYVVSGGCMYMYVLCMCIFTCMYVCIVQYIWCICMLGAYCMHAFMYGTIRRLADGRGASHP